MFANGLADDLAPEAAALALELRRLAGRLDSSMTGYAAAVHRDRSTLSRYFSGREVPSAAFVERLMEDGDLHTNRPLTDGAREAVRQSHRAAQHKAAPQSAAFQALRDELTATQRRHDQAEARASRLEAELAQAQTQAQPRTGSAPEGEPAPAPGPTGASGVHPWLGVGADQRPPYRLQGLRPPAPRLTAEQARQQPSRLLQARYEVVDFTGRDEVIDRLVAWREGPGTVSVLLVHGAGGQGKTRLATHFARTSQEFGWQAMQAYHADDPAGMQLPEEPPSPQGPRAGVLVIVDYAERWPVPDLLELLAHARLQGGGPVRVLLLARAAGDWWDGLELQLTAELGLSVPPALDLPPLGRHRAWREALFSTARDHFGDVLQVTGVGRLAPPPSMHGNPAFELVLTVHMAALVAVLDHPHDTRAPGQPAELSASLLRRERLYWQHLHERRGPGRLETDPAAMGQVVFTATLTGPLARPEALAALGRAGIESAQHPGRLLKDHALCYPPVPGGRWLEPLYPDRLGEDFLALTTPGHQVRGYTSDDWAATALGQLLVPVAGAGSAEPAAWTRQALSTLVETARRWPHVAKGPLSDILVEHPDLALATGGTVLTALAGLDALRLDALEAVDARLPQERRLDLLVGIAALQSRLVAHRLASTADPADHAAIHRQLARHYWAAGLDAQALAASEQALAIVRPLARDDPGAHNAQLAYCLHSLALGLSHMGRDQEAWAASEEGVVIRRQLAIDDPVGQEPYLVAELDNLALYCERLGRQARALELSLEALAVCRRLAAVDPAAHQPPLGKVLANHAVLSALPLEERRAAAEEAVLIGRRWTTADPTLPDVELAGALDNLSLALGALGRSAEALPPIREAVAIRRRQAELVPGHFEPFLAELLIHLANALKRLDQHQEALEADREAVALCRTLAAATPAAHEQLLAESLCTLAEVLLALEQPGEALTAAAEALTLAARHPPQNPDLTLRARSARLRAQTP